MPPQQCSRGELFDEVEGKLGRLERAQRENRLVFFFFFFLQVLNIQPLDKVKAN